MSVIRYNWPIMIDCYWGRKGTKHDDITTKENGSKGFSAKVDWNAFIMRSICMGWIFAFIGW